MRAAKRRRDRIYNGAGALCRVSHAVNQPPARRSSLAAAAAAALVRTFRPVPSCLFSHFPSYLLPPSHTHRRYLTPNAHLYQVSHHVLSFSLHPPPIACSSFAFFVLAQHDLTKCHITLSLSFSHSYERQCGWDERLETSFSVDKRKKEREKSPSFRFDSRCPVCTTINPTSKTGTSLCLGLLLRPPYLGLDARFFPPGFHFDL